MRSDELLPVLWRRRWTAVVAALLVFGAIVAYVSQLPAVYNTTSYLLVTPSRPPTSDFEATQISRTLTETYGELLQADNTARQVQTRLGPEFAGGDVEGHVTIGVSENQLLTITADGPTGRQAQLLANTYAEEFARRSERFGRLVANAADVTVAEYAVEPAQPSAPRTLLYLLIGGVLAAAAGAGAALLRHRLDQRLDIADEDVELLGLPIIGRIPRAGVRGSNRSSKAIAEAYRLLFANLTFVSDGRRPSSIAVVSAAEQEGKSTSVLGIARAAAETEVRTLIVDGDMRRPTLGSKLGIVIPAGTRGLSSALIAPDLDVVALSLPLSGGPVRLLAPGPAPPNATALLSGGGFTTFHRNATDAFDLVVIDTPPLGVAADASLIGAKVDAVVLVVDVRKTRRKSLVRAIDQMRRAQLNILGVALNQVGGLTESTYYSDGRASELDAPQPLTSAALR